jgi:hypothetical protein
MIWKIEMLYALLRKMSTLQEFDCTDMQFDPLLFRQNKGEGESIRERCPRI